MRLSEKIINEKYLCDGEKTWDDIANRVTREVLNVYGVKYKYYNDTLNAIKEKKFIPAGRFLYSAGRRFHQIFNCISMNVEDSREGWADLLWKVAMALQTGAGIGIRYNKIRPKGSLIHGTGGIASGVPSLIKIVDSIGQEVVQGGSRRSAIMAMLDISHPDAYDVIRIKNEDGSLSCTNVSIELQKESDMDNSLFDDIIDGMLRNGEPGIVINFNTDEVLRNVCGEMTSNMDSTPCCLGSINLGNIDNINEFEKILIIAVGFLVAGTVYSDIPYKKVSDVQKQNRRIGIGLMGIHEFLIRNGLSYKPCNLLEDYLKVFETSTVKANQFARLLNISEIKKSRAIAPTGTISMVAETTGGIEPIFSKEYIRQYYNKQGVYVSEHVIDPVAEKIMGKYGLKDVETVYDISLENRLGMQKLIQKYTDMAVSSTINILPDSIDRDKFKTILREYIPHLKGLTVYPLGTRKNEPFKPIRNETSCKEGFCMS